MEQTPADLVPGLTRWRPIGRGGFGVVYLVDDAHHGRQVAVKVLATPDLDERARRTFDGERRAMGTLSSHPNIVAVFSSGLTGQGAPYIVMDHMAGGSLADLLAEDGPLPWQQVATIGAKIAAALEAAHRVGIVHRDVKPANILVSAWREPALADFGIARIASATGSTTGTTSASIAHAAPEVLDGKRATAASDLYSLGSTLYELVSGTPPFVQPDDESIVPVIARVLSRPPPDLRDHGLPDGFAGVIERALHKDPAQRYASAQAFGEALCALLAEDGKAVPTMICDLQSQDPPEAADILTAEPSAAGVDVLPGKAETSGARRGWVPVAGLVGSLIVVAVVIVTLASRGGDQDDATPSGGPDPDAATSACGALPGRLAFISEEDGTPVLGTVCPTGADPQLFGALGAARTPALSPDGTAVAYIDDSDGLSVLELASGEHTQRHGATVVDPAWAPDSRSLAFAAEVDGQFDLFVMDPSGELSQLTSTAADEVAPSWSTDGELLAYATNESGNFDIWLVHVDLSGDRQLTSGPEDDMQPAYHPDGSEVVFVRPRDDGVTNLWTVSTEADRPRQVTNDEHSQLRPSFSPDGRHLALAADADGDFDLYLLELETMTFTDTLDWPGAQLDPSWGG